VRVIQKRGQPASLRHLVPGAFAALLTVLAVLAPLSPVAQWGLAGLVLLYVSSLLAASFVTARINGASLFPALLVAFPCYHLGYGYGFLAGTWDFAIRRQRGRFTSLSRT
jgi:hypothetical protein